MRPAPAPAGRPPPATGSSIGVTAAPFIRSGVADAIDLARRAERVGYDSFWVVSLRPPTEPDLPAITAMWHRCTPATRLARFHAPVHTIPTSYLDAVTADPAASLVAVDDRTAAVVASASLIRHSNGQSADLGVLVEDAWQRRGIGRRLVTSLLTAAPARGITVLTAAILTEHAAVASLLRQVPGEFASILDGPTMQVMVRMGLARPTECSPNPDSRP